MPAYGRHQAGRAAAKITSFYWQCSTLCIICWNSTAQEAAINSHVCRSPARLLQNSVLLKTRHLLSVLLCIQKAMGTQKENLCSWKKGVFIFSTCRDYKKAFKHFLQKLIHAEKKKLLLWHSPPHWDPGWIHPSRDLHVGLSIPHYAVLIKIYFPLCIYFQWKCFLYYHSNHTTKKLLVEYVDSLTSW